MKRAIRYALNHLSRPTLQRAAKVAMPVVDLFYRGSRYECPVCGQRFRKMLPYGYVVQRPNALCPHCMALERHRLLWLYIVRETDLLTVPHRMLHIAPESCFIGRLRKAMGNNYVTADLESPLADVKMNIEQMPFADEEFDVVFCNHILEHVDDDRCAIAELYRVMRPGSWGVVLSPVNPSRTTTYEDPTIVSPEARREAFGQPDHLRDYGTDFADRLREGGFRVDQIDYFARLTTAEQLRYALRPETIYVVKKTGA
ncbi:MAG: methyltransferase domain-containing protein [Tidjanibacter sp.]|nr:methyltransferase domain-containing protein [Tidjanibacter sp.]